MLKTQAPLASAATGAAGLDSVLFREGMSRVAGAVHVVSTGGARGRAGFTATAIAPVTDSPASLLVCVNAADTRIADVFAGRADLQGEARFSVGEWETLATGSPVLTSALVSFDCRLTDARIVATHHIIIGEIVAIRLGEARSTLVYQGRAYREL